MGWTDFIDLPAPLILIVAKNQYQIHRNYIGQNIKYIMVKDYAHQ